MSLRRARGSERAGDRDSDRERGDGAHRANAGDGREGEGEEDEEEEQDARRRKAPAQHVVHAAILREGEAELQRPSSALFWSGLAAGLSMGFSLLGEAFLRRYLPEAEWTPLVSKLGYSIGFLIVILGRQQLFTEDTLTPILPLLRRRTPGMLRNVLRLWGVVLAANLLGGLAVAAVIAFSSVLDERTLATVIEIGREATARPVATILWRSVFAGWLIALIVWLLPFAESARVLVIAILTYVIGIGHFPHVVAGGISAFVLAWSGLAGWGGVLVTYVLPALVGNVIGGVTLVAAVNHAQVVGDARAAGA